MDAATELLNFLAKYHEMRETQRKYFKTRNQGILIRSKELERELDAEKNRLITEMNTNPTLFDE